MFQRQGIARKLTALTVLLVGTIGLSACETDSSTRSTSVTEPPTYSGWTTEGEIRRAAEPAPRVEPARAAPRTGPCPPYAPQAGREMGVVALAFPTGDPGSSALMVHHVTPREVRLGQEYMYEIHVTNLTQGSLQNVVVTQLSRDNLDVANSDPRATRGDGGNLQWSLGDLAPCTTRVIKINAKASRVGNASDCITVSYNNALCAVTRVVEPALALRKTITPEALLCDNINLQFEVRNSGTGVAENVVIRDRLANGLTTPDGKNVIELPVGNLAAGESRTLNAVVKAARTGRYENNATASASGNLTAESNTVATVVRQPVLTISCEAREEQYLGRDFNYRFCIKNTGEAPAADTIVTAALPAGATMVSASDGGTVAGGNLSWRLGTLAPNQERCVTVTLRSNAAGTFRLSASARATCAEPVSTNCQTELKGIPALLLDGVDDPDPVEVGNNTVYTLQVTNQGSAPLTNVRLVCTMEEGKMEYVSSTGPTQARVQGTNITFAPIATLAPGQSATFAITVRATAPGQVAFRAEATSNEITRPLIKSETTNFYR